jgi:hypothetical protein
MASCWASVSHPEKFLGPPDVAAVNHDPGLVTFPFALTTLTLPGPTSSGTARWVGFGPPVYVVHPVS